MSDHYPWFSEPIDRAAFLADVARLLASAPPAWPRTAIRYGWEYCLECGFLIDYCDCLPVENAAPESDGVKRELIQRAMQRGGR